MVVEIHALETGQIFDPCPGLSTSDTERRSLTILPLAHAPMDAIAECEPSAHSNKLPLVGKYPVSSGVFQCQPIDWYMETAMVQPVVGNASVPAVAEG